MRKKKRQRNRAVVVRGDGDPCPRCGVPMQIREFDRQGFAPAAFLYPLVLLHEQKLSHDTGHARALQGHEPSDVRRCVRKGDYVTMAMAPMGDEGWA
jgi:hypothetical protein